MIMRQIEKKDNAALATIIRNSLLDFNAAKPGTVYYDDTTDDLFAVFASAGSRYFVVELDDEVVGGGGIFPTEGLPEGTCELVKLYLHKKARGKGIGKILISNCFEAAKELGYQKVYLETMPELNIAVPLYEKLGFVKLPGALGNSGHTGCDIWMIKELDKGD